MDQSVLDAQIRWPDVPAAYGWLSLSARGECGYLCYFAQQLQSTQALGWFHIGINSVGGEAL